MQVKEIVVERTFQIIQFEPLKISLSANINENDNIQEVIDKLYQECMTYRRSLEGDNIVDNIDSRGRRRK